MFCSLLKLCSRSDLYHTSITPTVLQQYATAILLVDLM